MSVVRDNRGVSVQISRGEDRFAERERGRSTRHAFSFGPHYDPARLSFGPMVCHDEHVLGRDLGFEEHPHAALEIVTWVVSGRVSHRDSLGNEAVLEAGDCGVLSAGVGVRHSEFAVDGPARFVQVWLTPEADRVDEPPHYSLARAADLPAVRGAGSVAGSVVGSVAVVGEGGALSVAVPGASYDVLRVDALQSVTLPASARVHAFVASGALLRSSLAEPLQAGDAFLLTDEPAHEVTAAVPTELLVWSFAG